MTGKKDACDTNGRRTQSPSLWRLYVNAMGLKLDAVQLSDVADLIEQTIAISYLTSDNRLGAGHQNIWALRLASMHKVRRR